MARLFFSYSHKDEDYRNQLEVHLSMLKRQGVISVWHDRCLLAGDEVDAGIAEELERADIVLLLVSPDFLASEYCYGIEMQRAMARHEQGTARVIPVILRPCEWDQTSFKKLLASPTDGKPVSKFTSPDDAFLDITKAIRKAAGAPRQPLAPATPARAGAAAPSTEPRSSNLRVKKVFTEHDRDRFLDESFEYLARFFENSLSELKARHGELETGFKRVDANCFTAAVYRDGAAISRCRIQLGGHLGGISFSYNQSELLSNAINESLSVEVGEQALTLRSMGMRPTGSGNNQLSQEGAAEFYWELFIERLQR